MGKKKRNKSGNPAAGSKTSSPTPSFETAPASQGKSKTQKYQRSQFWASQAFEWLSIALASAFAFWALTARLKGVTVSVLIDEYVYVLDAHYKAFSESGYPNHLFQLIYSSTKACGPEFYECARSINALFVLASGLIVYFFAKHISSGKKWAGAAGWLVTVFGSFGTYTAYFMPEAIFNFFMVAFFFALIKYGSSDRFIVWTGLGVLLGLAALAKPHGLFVVPAILLYIFLSSWFSKERFPYSSFKRGLVFVTFLLISKLGIGYLIAGENGFSLFGSYSYAVSSGEAVAQTLNQNTWLNVPQTAWGQTIMIVMILGMALPVAIAGLLQSLRKYHQPFQSVQFRTLFALSLLNMMAVSALFEAWQNLNSWMHTRYYSYLIPLALLVLIEAYVNHTSQVSKKIKVPLVLIFVIVSGIALFTTGAPYNGNWIDAPDFKAHISSTELSSIAIVAGIFLAFWWIWSKKNPVLYAIVLFVAAAIYSGNNTSQFLSDTFGKNDPYQRIGTMLSNYLPEIEVNKTVLVGNDGVLMQRVLFYSLSGGASAVGGQIETFDPESLPEETRWVLAFGESFPSNLGDAHLTGPGYALFSTVGPQEVTPRTSESVDFSNRCADVLLNEWACGEQTEIKVEGGFPANAKVSVIIEGDDLLAGSEVDIALGDSVGTIILPKGKYSLPISFTNSTPESTLLIKLKQPEGAAEVMSRKFIRIVSLNLEN